MTTSTRLLLIFLCSALVGTADAGILFSEPVRFPSGTDPSAVASADLDGDDNLDLIVVNRTSDDAYVYLGDGSGGFQFFQSFAVGNFPNGVATADFDGDTLVDIATTAVPFNSGTVSAWPGNGDGSFQTATVLTADDGTRSVEIVDIDDDGRLDLVVTNPSRGNISTFLGDGDGTFGAEIRTAVGNASSFPTDLAVADFNGDGRLDVVTSNAQSSDASIGLVLGDGDGSYSLPTTFPTTCGRPESVVAGDFNRDGWPDVAVACFVSSDVAVMLGNGNGAFAAPQLYNLLPAPGNPYWILAGDFDNDGIEDLVTANNGSFSVLEGNGDGSFKTPFAVESQPGTFFGAHAADFDEDGWLDLAFTNPGLDEVTVFLNTTGICLGQPCAPYLEGGASSTLSWSAVPGALGYDVIRGDLGLLRGSAGDFGVATTDCVAGLTPLTSYTDAGMLAGGEGFWFLVREVTAEGAASYDAHSGNLADGRDLEVAGSGSDCP